VDAPFRQYLGWERFPENLTEPEVAHSSRFPKMTGKPSTVVGDR
jgi:hypothetical protein